MQLRQFVVSRAHATLNELAESVKTYEELIEVDTSSRSQRCYNRDYAPRNDYSGSGDYRNQPPDMDNYY